MICNGSVAITGREFEERDVINQAVDSVRTDLTSFALSSLRDASRRVLADRSEFVLRDDQTAGWDRINETPARGLLAPLSLALEHWSLPAVEK